MSKYLEWFKVIINGYFSPLTTTMAFLLIKSFFCRGIYSISLPLIVDVIFLETCEYRYMYLHYLFSINLIKEVWL